MDLGVKFYFKYILTFPLLWILHIPFLILNIFSKDLADKYQLKESLSNQVSDWLWK